MHPTFIFISYRYVEQKSCGYHMTSGDQYYIEGVYRETAGSDYMQVVMKIPGVNDEWLPVSSKYLRRI